MKFWDFIKHKYYVKPNEAEPMLVRQDHPLIPLLREEPVAETQIYKNAFPRVKKLIDEADIEGLLSLGAPADEYKPEINCFCEMIAAGAAITPDVVISTWAYWFDYEGSGMTPMTSIALASELNTIAHEVCF